jgi:hypothetical protein
MQDSVNKESDKKTKKADENNEEKLR